VSHILTIYLMPPSKLSGGKDNVDDETDEVLQAVILADSFNKRFKPLTIDRPKVYALRALSVHSLNGLASVSFPSAMPLCWIGRWKALLLRAYRRFSSYAAPMPSK
jgi:hypothetical protein